MAAGRELTLRLAQQAEAVCRYLLPAGKRVGDEWQAGDLSGAAGSSLKVRLTPGEDGRPAGLWTDHATGEAGDFLDLWIEIKGLTYNQAITEVAQWLGDKPENGIKGYGAGSRMPLREPERPKCAPIWRNPSADTTSYLIASRRLSQEVLRKYRIAADSHRIVLPYLREGRLVNIQYRHIREKKSYFTKDCAICLWGWQAISPRSKQVVITEGQFDAMTVAMFGFEALSLPNGINGLGWIEIDYELLEQFDDIVFLLDNDQPGMAGINRLFDRIGRHRCRLAMTPNPIKDANDALCKHGWGEAEFTALIRDARPLSPEELTAPDGFLPDVLAEFYPSEEQQEGTLWLPFGGIGENVWFPPGEITLWSGYTKHGKTSLLNQLLVHGVYSGLRICDASLEMPARKTLANMVRQATGVEQPSREFVAQCMKWLQDSLFIYNHVGTVDVDKMLDVFTYAARRYGVQQFVIDSLMMLGISDEDNAGQKKLMQKLCDFKSKTNTHLHLVAHAKKQQDDLNPPNPMTVLGSSAIINMADNLVVVHRNVTKQRQAASYDDYREIDEKILHAHDAQMIVYHQRDRGGPYYCKLWYDDRTLTFRDRAGKMTPRKFTLTLVK